MAPEALSADDPAPEGPRVIGVRFNAITGPGSELALASGAPAGQTGPWSDAGDAARSGGANGRSPDVSAATLAQVGHLDLRKTRTFLAIVALELVGACANEGAPKKDVPAATQQATGALTPTATHERPMALRREGQGLLDSARVALIGGDAGLAATLLEQGASFLVKQAHAPPNRGTDDLIAAARGLDSLAKDIRHRRSTDASRLDRLSAHANLAEAERHVALASVAWSTRSKESVVDELTMASDHIQRAASDGRLVLSPAMRSDLANLPEMVRVLSTQRGLDMRELDEPLGSLHVEIQAMHRKLEQAANRP